MKEFDITQSLIYNLDLAARMAKIMGMRFFENSKELDITFNDFFIINTLYMRPNMHQRELAKLLFKGAANLSRDIDKLENKGLLKSKITTKDKWVVKVLSLTKEGEIVLKKAISLSKKHIDRIHEIYTPEEFSKFKEFLERFRNDIKEREGISLD